MTRTMILCAGLVLGACHKKSNDAKPAGEPTAAPEAAAAAPAAPSTGGCPPTFTYNTTGKFCIKLPPKLAGNANPPGSPSGNGTATQHGWAGGDAGSDYGITVMVMPMNEEAWVDSLERVKQPPYEGKLVADGKLDGGGAWATGDDSVPGAGKNQRHWIHTVAKSDTHRLTCEITRAGGVGAPSEAEVFEACKTIAFAKR